MKKTLRNTAYFAGILTLGIALGVTIKLVSAWVEPDQMPPGGNIVAPLNTGTVGQIKLGGLVLNYGGVLDSLGLIVHEGRSGFGIDTPDPNARVDVNGNLKVNGRIFGVQAPTNGNDVTTKNYVDAAISGGNGGGGGGTYIASGLQTCATGWTVAYTGVLVGGGVLYNGGVDIAVPTDTFCVADFKGSENGYGAIWASGKGGVSFNSIPCALCVK